MKRNALLIGAFVIAALAMVVIGVLWLSGNDLFKKQQEAMIYYKGNVTGLYVGAPVGFRGVAIGQVENIDLQVDSQSLKALVPVRIRLRTDAMHFSGAEKGAPVDLRTLVQRGLRARLVAQSFVTGQKSIELDFVPNTPATLVGGGTRPEIPALAERFGALIDQVAELPLADTVQEILDQTEVGVEDELKRDTDRCTGDHERREDGRPDQVSPDELAIEQHGQRQTDDHRTHNGDQREYHCVGDDLPGIASSEPLAVVAQPDERRLRVRNVPVEERKSDVVHQRAISEQDQQREIGTYQERKERVVTPWSAPQTWLA